MHEFEDGSAHPTDLARSRGGNFFGLSADGGSTGNGEIFQLTPGGTCIALYGFSAVDDHFSNREGSIPSELIEANDGHFYGTTITGGSAGQGTVFEVTFPPVILSAAKATATVGQPFSYQIAARNNPTSYGVQGLIGGLSINASTGLISGTPKTAGTYALTLRAFNNDGPGSSPLTLTVLPDEPPVITSATTASGKAGMPFTYQMGSG